MDITRGRIQEMVMFPETIDPNPPRHLVEAMAVQMENAYIKIENLTKQREADDNYECNNCGSPTYRIDGYRLDRDGMRDCRFCPDCKVVLKVTCSGFDVEHVLKDRYDGTAKARIDYSLRQALAELEAE